MAAPAARRFCASYDPLNVSRSDGSGGHSMSRSRALPGRAAVGRAGWRNGYEPMGVPTEAGLLQLVPQLRGTKEPFRSKLAERLGWRSVDLKGLVRGMHVRDCPSRT